MNSLSSNVNGKFAYLWILETGIIDHISFNLPAFTNCRSIVPIYVTLPDGSQLSASISGSVNIIPSLILHNVLYIPSFNVNLISIAKLSQNSDYTVQFTTNSCSSMQNPSKKIIGIVELQNELYVLDSTEPHSTCNYVFNNRCNVWYMRLGHLYRFSSYC